MAMMGNMPDRYNVVVNTNHPLAQRILKARGKREAIIKQLFDLALLSQGVLSGDQLTTFLHRSIEVLED
ncbi:MAG: molecular chaperone HtpG, partial [Bacteroidota bacterium]|nr:molecular chaperone HtpG [Bacteroidota bacterium]